MDEAVVELFARFARPPGIKDYVAWLWSEIEGGRITKDKLRSMRPWPDEAFTYFEFPDEVKAAVDWASKQPIVEPSDPADDPEFIHEINGLRVDTGELTE